MGKTALTVAAAGLSIALVVGPAPAATADSQTGPAQHVLDKAIEGLVRGSSKALAMLEAAETRNPDTGIPIHALGNPDHATGLARAQKRVEAAALKLKGYEKNDSGKGNAYGRGHAELVHAALSHELSPSTLAPSGVKALRMVKAVEAFTVEKPGRGLGRNDKGTDGDD